jgi:hypothetical protein
VSITPEANVAYLEQMFARIEEGAAAAANAMARYIAERTANDTLTQNKHAPGAYHRARPGAPPSYASGRLAAAMFHTPASAGLTATAIVGNSDKRARALEFGGCVLRPAESTHLGWKDTGRKDNPSGIWRHRQVYMPEHPFLGPTTDEAIDDGELARVAIDEFRKYDP